MTYSPGPGGYGGPPQGPSGQGYGQQPQGYGAAPGRGQGKGLPFFLNVGVIALGVLSLFLGFAPYASKGDGSGGDEDPSDSINFFLNAGLGVGVIGLALLLTAAAIAAFGMLPKQQSNEAVVAGLSVGGFVTLLFLLIGLSGLFGDVNAGIGLILVLITSFLQAALSVAVLLFSAGIIKPPQPSQQQYGYYGQGGSGYGQQQPQQPYYGGGAPGSGPSYQQQPPPSQPPQQPQNPW